MRHLQETEGLERNGKDFNRGFWNPYKNADRYNPMKIDICKECLREKGFDVVRNYEQSAENNKKTLEDKLLKILEDLGVSFEE